MESLRETLNQNWISVIIGVVGAIIGILVTILVGYLFSTRLRLATQINSLQLLGPNPVLPSDIEFLFKGQKVPNVTLSRIAIWNFGNTTLNGNQIVETDPLRITTSDGSVILEATILNRTREVNGFSCHLPGSERPNQAVCTFDYLDPQDGGLIQIIHTGSDDVKVIGTLRGIRRKIMVIGVSAKESKIKRKGEQSSLEVKGLGSIMVLSGLSLVLIPIVHPSLIESDPRDGPFFVTMGLFLTLFGMLTIWIGMRMPPKTLSTQITTLESPKPFWHRLFSTKKQDRL